MYHRNIWSSNLTFCMYVDQEITIMQLSSSSNVATKHDVMMDSMSTSSSTATMCSSMAGQVCSGATSSNTSFLLRVNRT